MNTLRTVIKEKDIIIAPGAYDVVSAEIIDKAGFDVVYISGLGVEASDLGRPDIGLTTETEITHRAGKIVQSVNKPVICDADTGYGGLKNVWQTVRDFEAMGVSAIHVEDQTFPKRCGALPGKGVVSLDEYVKKLKVMLDARRSDDFFVIARTDAKILGIDEVIRRLKTCSDIGADMLFLGDFYTRDEYRRVVDEVRAPIITCDNAFLPCEQPVLTTEEWKAIGVKMVIYWSLPLFAAMKAISKAVHTLKEKGTVVEMRDEIISYEEYGEIVELRRWLEFDSGY
jgi:2-methylisocitrate lyase-like PEP mutase family enzyme